MEIHLQCNVFIVFLMVFHVFLFILIIVLSVFSFVKEKSSILKKSISKNEEILQLYLFKKESLFLRIELYYV